MHTQICFWQLGSLAQHKKYGITQNQLIGETIIYVLESSL